VEGEELVFKEVNMTPADVAEVFMGYWDATVTGPTP
jgi:hypothetical protein